MITPRKPTNTNTNDTGFADVRAASVEEYTQICAVLTDIFKEDPAMRWMFPEDELWRQCGPEVFKWFMTPVYGTQNIQVVGNLKAAAIWHAPSVRPQKTLDAYRVFRMTKRLKSIACYLSSLQHARPKEPHWRLVAIGSQKYCQGQGVGHRLLSAGIRQLESSGAPIFLETSYRQNVQFYEKSGFLVVDELNKSGLPRTWFMLKRN